MIIYDIVNNSRRAKFARFLEGYGKRVQKSAFEAYLTDKKAAKLISKIPPFCTEEDSIRVYRINGTGQFSSWGRRVAASDEAVIVI